MRATTEYASLHVIGRLWGCGLWPVACGPMPNVGACWRTNNNEQRTTNNAHKLRWRDGGALRVEGRRPPEPQKWRPMSNVQCPMSNVYGLRFTRLRFTVYALRGHGVDAIGQRPKTKDRRPKSEICGLRLRFALRAANSEQQPSMHRCIAPRSNAPMQCAMLQRPTLQVPSSKYLRLET